jgi:soluble lytic murein transglycosylase
LQSVGNTEAANQAWEGAIVAEPATYFSMRACALLNGTPPYEPSGGLRLQDFTAEDIRTAELWMAQTFALPEAPAALSAELAANPLLVRGTELWALGFAREANAEFIALHRRNRDNPLAMFQLATYYRAIGAFRASIIAATRVTVLANQPIPDIPGYIARMAYPIHFSDLIVARAQQYGLDPLYLASLIRQESTFDASAVSIAGARGLMQLMPATAADVARRLGMSSYEVGDLFRPTVNIQFGAYYLASTRDFLNGDIVGALIGYNAGPGRAAQWSEAAAGDIDVLHETIPFEETRLYLEITYKNFAAYRALYGDGMPACMFTVASQPAA